MSLCENNKVMSYDPEISNDADSDIADSIADDALQLFKSGLTLAVIYVTLVSLILRDGGAEAISTILNSSYTTIGVIFWAGSMTTCLVTYWGARQSSSNSEVDSSSIFSAKNIQFNYPTMVLFGLLVSLFSLMFGIVEGWYKAYEGISGSIPVSVPIVIIIGSISYLFGGYVGLHLLLGFVNWILSETNDKLNNIIEYLETKNIF